MASEDIMAKFKPQESNIEKLVGVATPLPLSRHLESCHLCTKNEILCTILHTAVLRLKSYKLNHKLHMNPKKRVVCAGFVMD